MKTKLSKLDKIKFLSYVYDVHWETPRDSKLNYKSDWGGINNSTNEIWIDTNMRQKERVLIHEATHLISDCFDCKLDESQINRMSEGFYHFLIDNNLLKTVKT